MTLTNLGPIVLAASLLTTPALLTTSPSAAPAPVTVQADDGHPLAIFPLPATDLEINLGGDATPTLADVLQRFEAISAHHLQISETTRAELRNITTGLSSTVKVPRAEVYSFVSALLHDSGFVMAETRSEAPRLMKVMSLNSQERGLVRNYARAIEADEIDKYVRHPAMLVETVISVEHTDARQLSNSMRMMIVDNNTQVLVPASEHSLFLIGTGPEVADWMRLIRAADANDTPRPEPAGQEGGEGAR